MTAPRPLHPLLKLALDLGPLLLFFVAFLRWDVFVATAVFMAAVVVTLAVSWLRERRLPPVPLVTAALVLVLGGLTLWLHDDMFLKLKLTLVNGLFGATLLVGLLLKKPLVKHLLGDAIALTDTGWKLMTRAWMAYFFGIAALNELVWRNTSTETWVRFKVIAVPAATLLFVIALSPLLARHATLEAGEDAAEG